MTFWGTKANCFPSKNNSGESLLFGALYLVVFVSLNFVFLRFGRFRVSNVNLVVHEGLVGFYEFAKGNAASSFREKHVKSTSKRE